MATPPVSDVGPGSATVLHSRVVAEVARSRQMAVPVAYLAGRLGMDPERAWGLAGEAERAGELSRWPGDPDGPSVALTPLVAGRLGLRPADDGLRWLAAGQADLPRKVRQSCDASPTGPIPGYRDRVAPA